MHMYHSWGSQERVVAADVTAANRYLNQISCRRPAPRHLGPGQIGSAGSIDKRQMARRLAVDGTTHEARLKRGLLRIRAASSARWKLIGVNPHTVWTWNAIGKRRGEMGDSVGRCARVGKGLSGAQPPHLGTVAGQGRRLPLLQRRTPSPGSRPPWFDLRVAIEKADGAHETVRALR
ncbi:MAG: hypothetical protein AcusKO_49130 [Acuticoccus sp.]